MLVGIVVVTGFVQQRQTMRNQTQPNPQMAIISKVFPVVFAFITWGLPSGVGLYFATSNVWQIGQQEVVFRTMMNPAGGAPPKKGEAAIEGAPDEGGGTTTKTREADADKGGGKPDGGKQGGAKPGASAARAAARGGGAKPSRGGSRPAKGEDAGGKDGGNGSKNGQARPAGGARSNRKRKR